MEFLDDATLATRSVDGKTRLWSVGGDEVVEKEVDGGKLMFSKEGGLEQLQRDHVINAEKEFVSVIRADSGDTVAVFLALQETIEVLDCAGDKDRYGMQE